MKKLFRISIVMMLLVLCASVFTACGVESVSILEDEMPQTTYVVGSDLNLADGKLTVKTKDGEQKVALNSSDVSVSGYDKDTLGEQVLTVSYKKKTTSLTVNVVNRAEVSSYTQDYFVGDAFDKSQGRMRITRDNGTQYSVYLSDDKVSITGFVSTTAGSTVTVTATYTNGDISYSGTFPVSICAVESVSLKKPTKLNYYSHDEDINLAGGKLTLTGKNGAVTKEVELTKDMISGFNLGAATDENRKGNELNQKITVTYLNQTQTFNVKITYTDVSEIKQIASELSSIDWTGEKPTVEQAQGEKAVKAMNMYLDLPNSLKSIITEEECLAFARPAFVHAYTAYKQDLVNFEGAFEIDGGGNVVLTCETYADTANAIQALDDKDRPFYVEGEFLAEILYKFNAYPLYGEVGFVSEAHPVYDPVVFDDEVLPALEFMAQAYEKLAPVATAWTADELESNATYKAAVEATYAFIKDAEWNYEILEIVSAWREKDDYLDILYAYYYAQADNEDELFALSKYGFPGAIGDVFNYFNAAAEQVELMFGYQFPIVFDSSDFFLNYYRMTETVKAIKNGSDAMIKDLYEKLTLNNIMGASSEGGAITFDTLVNYVKTMKGGYQSLCANGYGNVAYEKLLLDYAKILDAIEKDETAYKASSAYDTDVQALLNGFVALSPSLQANFLTTIHITYAPTAVESYPALALDYNSQREDNEGEVISQFVALISEYYESKFTTDEGKNAFADLLLAIEHYSHRYTVDAQAGTIVKNESAFTSFSEKLAAVEKAYVQDMTATEKAVFETYLKDIFDKYSAISEYHASDFTATDLGTFATTFSGLEEITMLEVQVSVSMAFQAGTGYSLMFGAFEKAYAFEKAILESGNQDIINAYYYEELCNVGSEQEPIMVSLEYVVNFYKTYYMLAITNFYGQTEEYDLDEYLKNTELRAFLEKTYDVSWVYVWKQLPEEAGITKEFEATKVYAAMNAFKALDAEDQVSFLSIDITGEDSYYYVALSSFFKSTMTEKAATFAESVLNLEMYYIAHVSSAYPEMIALLEEMLADPTYEELVEDIEGLITEYEAQYAASIENLENTLADMATAYSQLSPDEQAELTSIKTIYDYYAVEAQKLIDEYEASLTPAP